MDRPDPIDPPEPYRRLSLLDLIGVVLVSGVGVWFWQVSDWSTLSWPGGRGLPQRRFDWFGLIGVQLQAQAGLVTLRSLHLPRDRRGRVGILLCTGAWFALLIGVARQVIEVWGGVLMDRPFDGVQARRASVVVLTQIRLDGTRISGAVAAGIVVAGLVVWRLGAWQRSADGMDRLGRWVALGLLAWFLGDCVLKTLQQIRIYRGDFEAM